MKSFLLLIPTFLCLLLFCAHLFRNDAVLVIPFVLISVPLLLIKHGVIARLFQLLLLFLAMQWVIFGWMLADRRMDTGEPWLRLALIMGGVALFNLVAAALFEAPPLMRRYPRKYLS